jgi:predicted phage baseplate assembly protein
MPLQDIQLDDLTFDSIKAELRRRIPRYTPEWTDFNESDPGITLIELFAWLADILVYRINKIPDKAYIQFLQMLGIQLNLPAAAQAYLTFTLTSQDLPNAIPIPGGTQVSLANAASGPATFETTDDLYACGATLQAVQTSDGAQYTVVTNFNPTDGTFWYPFGKSPQAGSALYLGFDRAFPSLGNYQFPLVFLVNTPAVQGSAPGLPTPALLSASLPIVGVLEYSTATGWGTINVVSDGTAALTQTGVMQFTAPSDWAAVQYGALRKSSDPAYYWMRYRIEQLQGPGYQSAPQLTNVLINTITAINAVTLQGEILGGSSGIPNQTFQLSNYPVLPLPAGVTGIVEVDEGGGYQLWTQVPNFAGQSSTSTVYTLDYSTGTVTFGDGEKGKIPQWLSSDGSNLETADTPNIRVTQYQYGGGSAGNSGANTINSLVNSVPYVASVTNLLPSSGGADEESVADAEDRAPAAIYSQERAVSGQDFINLALQTPGGHILRAAALPLQRPITQVIRNAQNQVVLPPPAPGVVTVLVVPDGPDPQMPVATDATLALVAKYLDQYRLATCELYVARPIYRQVEIQATVIVQATADSGAVLTDLTNALLAFYNPLKGGPLAPGATEGSGWPFGRTIYFSEAYGQILQDKRVQYVDNLQIYLDGKLQPANQDIPLQPFELVYSTQHTLDVSYSS